MRKNIGRHKKSSKIQTIILDNIKSNFNIYIICCIIIILGIIFGVIFINNLEDNQKVELDEYINSFLINADSLQIRKTDLLYKTLIKNIVPCILLWLAGISIIGLLLDYILIFYKGFCLGYTISIFVLLFGKVHGMILSFLGLLLQNTIIIPAIFIITSSGMKILKNIVKNSSKETIFFQYLRHTIVSILALAMILCSTFIEVFFSYEMLLRFI